MDNPEDGTGVLMVKGEIGGKVGSVGRGVGEMGAGGSGREVVLLRDQNELLRVKGLDPAGSATIETSVSRCLPFASEDMRCKGPNERPLVLLHSAIAEGGGASFLLSGSL